MALAVAGAGGVDQRDRGNCTPLILAAVGGHGEGH